MPMRWTIVSDGDGRSYVVPADKAVIFTTMAETAAKYWNDLDRYGEPEEADPGEGSNLPPDPADEPWAHKIEGGILTFEAPKYEGKELIDG